MKTPLALMLVLLAAAAPAAILHVDSTATGSNDGTTFANAFPDLQQALAAALPGDEIRVAAGTYHPDVHGAIDSDDRAANFVLPAGVAIMGGFPVGGGALPTRNPVAHPTILSGDIDQDDASGGDNSGNSFHLVAASDAAITNSTVLDGFTITAGNADGSGSLENLGGGLVCLGGAAPTVANCTFEENQAASAGGAVFIESSTPAFTACTFADNSATAGGAIFAQLSANPSFTDCSFTGNQSSGNGGAVTNILSSTPAFLNCSFRGNESANKAGAMINNNSTATLTNCLFSGNVAASDGGAVVNTNASPTFVNCSFQGNLAGDEGGAIANLNGAAPSVVNGIIWNNTASNGSSAGSASVFNSGGSAPSWSHCLLEHLNPPGTNNLDGTIAANAPGFLSPVDPLSAPTTAGDFRLGEDSPALDLGLNSANLEPLDLGGASRIRNFTIDLGAHELQQGVIYVKASASGGADGSSWSNAFPILQHALAIALPGDEIWVAVGVYRATQGALPPNNGRSATFALKPGVAMYGSFPASGNPTFGDRFPATFGNSSSLQGDPNQSIAPYHVVTADGTGSGTVLDGFSIEFGHADGPTEEYKDIGGGIVCINSASPVISNCIFYSNFAATGAAIGCQASSPTVSDCLFLQGLAVDGGAIGMRTKDSRPSISGCVFRENRALWGGAISNPDRSLPTISDCSFENNTAAAAGGAISTAFPTIGLQIGGLTVTNCSFVGNVAECSQGFLGYKPGGGAIFVANSWCTITGCSFLENHADDFLGDANGGAIDLNNTHTAIIVNCTFNGNWADDNGGAISGDSASGTIVNSAFQGNLAGTEGSPGDGGAIAGLDGGGLTLENCTLQGNRATGEGGAIFSPEGASLQNSIIWQNASGGSTTTPGASVVGVNYHYYYSLVQHIAPTTTNLDGTDPAMDPRFISEVDPFSAPTASGGNLRLGVSSPAIDAGVGDTRYSSLDLAGNPRTFGTIDLGAYEADFTTLYFLTDSDNDGRVYGVELALGTNPSSPDPVDPRDPSLTAVDSSGNPTVSFGRNPSAPDGMNWVLSRSTDLLTFDPIFRFDGTTILLNETGNTADLTDPDRFTITDTAPPSAGAYYRFEAEYLP